MTRRHVYGPRPAQSDAGQAFLADLANRPQFWREAIGGALARLAELPTRQGWRPVAGHEAEAEQWAAVGEVYQRGVLAACLVADAVYGEAEFYTREDFAVRGERVQFLPERVPVALLVDAEDAMRAAVEVYAALGLTGWFGEHVQEHAVFVLRLFAAVQEKAGRL